MKRLRFLVQVAALFCLSCPLLVKPAEAQEEESRGAPAEPSDAQEVREQIKFVENLLPKFPDRAGALYFLALAHQHLHENVAALDRLKECLELEAGFDPSGSQEFGALKGDKNFDELVEKVHAKFPVESHARAALLAEAKDLIPEGLAWDEKRQVFYLGSLNLRKIVEITPESRSKDFVPSGRDRLLPILGIRVNAKDGTVWAASFEEAGNTELLHFDSSGTLLERFAPGEKGPHGFNDLVIRSNGEILVTDSLAGRVFRFDPAKKSLSTLALHRLLLYPNGIALAADDHTLYVADSLGVLRVDLAAMSSQDVDPGKRSTLSGVDGLYWRDGWLVAIQNGIGSPRVAAFKLSKDGLRVARTSVLESRTTFTELPTTGAIRGSEFYFITNSQIDNLLNDKVRDVTRLAPVRIASVRLP